MPNQAEAVTGPGPDQTFRNYLNDGLIKIQKCVSSGEYVFPPRVMCPTSRSRDCVWVDVTGGGEIYSTSIVRRKADRGGDYSIVLVVLDEGVRMMSTVLNVDPSEVTIGQRVRLNVGDLDGVKAVVLTIEAEEQK